LVGLGRTSLCFNANLCSQCPSDFYWCKGTEPGQERSCSTNWSIKSGIITWVELTRAGKYPVSERCLPYNPTSRARCSYDCQDVDPRLKLGKFYWQRLQDPSEMQDQIRQFGSVRGTLCIGVGGCLHKLALGMHATKSR
jgi:hypothetical protein